MKSKGSILTSQSDFDNVSNQNPFKSKLGLSYLGGISLGYHITPRSKVYLNTKMRVIPGEINNPNKVDEVGPAFHEKSEKNSKENQGGSYKRIIKKKYKKPQTRGDKNYNKRKKGK